MNAAVTDRSRAVRTVAAMFTALLIAAVAGGHFNSHSARVTNPWFPLRPGSVYRYTGVKDGKATRETLRVTHTTKTIAGVRCITVDDRLYTSSGHLIERTHDWYAQDRAGNVWYFGENTAELNAAGKVTSREGTWRARHHGAQPGIYMPSRPRVGQTGRQEYYKGHAEDHFKVLKVGARILVTQETTPLEPGVVDHKTYRRGVGTVVEQTVKGGDERNTLVSYRR
jgi:hypothetical protein